ncbi:hypothetical protein ARMSODRAFT_974066 [Armillaria solidipes]|uniref:Uncharacterized protein n=1 Tax=Armillaria solidipes TaxID=1076256 RepID=A0A2H3BJ06_9AGAR|nr:hypothetical protein ARMSODRAFT_974066 [Armillaria solidipes]
MQATRLLASPPPFKTERPSSASNSATSSDRIYRTNVPYHSIVVKPFEEDSPTEPSAMLLDMVLKTHAWASSCPKHESDLAVPMLEKKISPKSWRSRRSKNKHENDLTNSSAV